MNRLLKSYKAWFLTAILFGFTMAQVVDAGPGVPGSTTNPVVTKGYTDKVLGPLRQQVSALQYEITVLKNNDHQETGWFSDVPGTYWAYKDIKTMVDKGIIKGQSATSFGPSLPTRRAELAVILVKALNLPLSDIKTNFGDLPESHWAYRYIATAQAKGIISGFPDGKFKPDEGVTRGQMAIMLKKAYSLSRNHNEADFKDVPKTYWAYDQIMCLADQGISKGFSDRTFKPSESVKRAEVAAFLSKAMSR